MFMWPTSYVSPQFALFFAVGFVGLSSFYIISIQRVMFSLRRINPKLYKKLMPYGWKVTFLLETGYSLKWFDVMETLATSSNKNTRTLGIRLRIIFIIELTLLIIFICTLYRLGQSF